MFKWDLEKAEYPEIKLPMLAGSSKKQESSRKTSTSALLTTPEALTAWIATKYDKLLKRWKYKTTWPASWEICMQVRKQQLDLDMEQQSGSKSGKEYVKSVYCHPACLTYMIYLYHESISCFLQSSMKHSWNQNCWEKSQQPQICIGEGNGTPLQYSCLVSPMDGGAW